MNNKLKLLVSPGLPRSGTTYTFHSLIDGDNRGVFNAPKSKEMNFFSNSSNYDELLECFNEHDKTKFFIDYSPSYFVGCNDSLDRMSALKNEIDFKFILHLRHPLDQMYAHYLHDIKAHISKREMGDNVGYSFFSEKSLKKYSALRVNAIKNLIKNFGDDNVLAINFYKDLSNPGLMTKKISSFLNVDLTEFPSQVVSPGGWLPYYIYGGESGVEIFIGDKLKAVPRKSLLLVNGDHSMIWHDVDRNVAVNLIEGSASWTREVTTLQFDKLFESFSDDWNETMDILGENINDYQIKPLLQASPAPMDKSLSSLLESREVTLSSRISACTYDILK
jgi:hypothetical protein